MSFAVLYISYEGMLEPLGQSQVLSYQERLASFGRCHLISFEKKHDWEESDEKQKIQTRISQSSIKWTPLRYHKRFSVLATTFDILVGVYKGVRLVRKHNLQLVHARSYVPAVMALYIKKITGAKFIFDMRGFWVDERVDGGIWPKDSLLYKFAKRIEKKLLAEADHIVSLTQSAAGVIRSPDYFAIEQTGITVIPTCADLARFNIAPKESSTFTVGYVGSASTWYAFDEVLECFRLILERRPAQLLIVNRNEHEYILGKLSKHDILPESVKLVKANHEDVPGYVQQMDVALFFYKPSFSRSACSPTKLGEFLGCGVPCLASRGVGDVQEILEANNVGVTVADFSSPSLLIGVNDLLELSEAPGVSDKCRTVAEQYFSLDIGVQAYQDLYQRLGASS